MTPGPMYKFSNDSNTGIVLHPGAMITIASPPPAVDMIVEFPPLEVLSEQELTSLHAFSEFHEAPEIRKLIDELRLYRTRYHAMRSQIRSVRLFLWVTLGALATTIAFAVAW